MRGSAANLAARLHHGDKAIKQRRYIARARAGFRVALKAKRRAVGTLNTLQGAIEQRAVCGTHVAGQGGFISGKAVVLAGDHHRAGI